MLRRIRRLSLRLRVRVRVARDDDASSRDPSMPHTPSNTSALNYQPIDKQAMVQTFSDTPFLDVPGSSHLPSMSPMTMPTPELADPDGLVPNDSDFSSIMGQVSSGPHFSKAERFLDRQGDVVDTTGRGCASLDTEDTVQALRSGIDTVWENVNWVMKALDEIAKIHPFVAAPILAFKAVYSMEKTRRENDKRIISLYFAMKEMISVLMDLRDVRDVHEVDLNGSTLASRMQPLADRAADDIKECANVCDTYSKKKLLVKVLMGPAWESRLTEFLDRFSQTRSQFEMALAVHTATTTTNISSAVNSISQKVDAVRDLLHGLFHEYQPEDELSIAAKVEERGGPDYVKHHDTILRELIHYEDSIESAKLKATSKFNERAGGTIAVGDQYIKLRQEEAERTAQKSNLAALKSDLREDVKTAVARNLETFELKFELQQKQLQEELFDVIHAENNRVIRKLDAGPHERILNQELRAIWHEMGWRRNVEANLFVTTLRDHFRDQADFIYSRSTMDPPQARTDEWAFDYIDIRFLQQLKEAFDEDGSGYITIREVNRLTQLLPDNLNWSLPHWVAYWTIGWQISATRYRDQIRALFAHIFALRTYVLPENRAWVDNYLEKVWYGAVRTIESLLPAKQVPAHVKTKFRVYVNLEEKRMAQNLESVQYNIDALETVNMISRTGKMEHHVFPLMYLLLRQHLSLLRLATRKPMRTEDELIIAANSLQKVYEAMSTRHRELFTLFKHQGLDVEQQMKSFACELFEYYHDSSPLWPVIHAQIALDQSTSDNILDNDDEDDDSDINVDDIESPSFEYPSPYDIPRQHPTPSDLYTTSPVRDILGEWNGFVYSENQYPLFLMTSFYAHISPSDESEFEASGTHYGSTYQLNGKCSRDSRGALQVVFVIHYSQEFRTKYFDGHFTADGSIIGYQGWHEGVLQYPFILKRTPAEVMCHRPSPLEFRANKPQALWAFACAAILNEVRRNMWSWSFFKGRRETRVRQIQYDIRNYTPYGRPLDKEERAEWAVIRQAMTAVDAIFFRSIRDNLLRIMPGHPRKVCDGCGYRIGGARIICLDCQPSDGNYNNTIDFCDDPNCYSQTVTTEARSYLKKNHVPTHDIVKVRVVHHFRDMHAMDQNARRALKAARHILEDVNIMRDHERTYNYWPGQESRPLGLSTRYTECFCLCRAGTTTRVARKNETCMTPDSRSEVQAPKLPLDVQRVWRAASPQPLSINNKPREVKCGVCNKVPGRPCWFCADCFALGKVLFICDSCEERTLLRCTSCTRIYQQPTWYYGARPGDAFICNTCDARQIIQPDLVKRDQHTYLHTLVRCKERDKTTWQEASDNHTNRLGRDVEDLRHDVMKIREMVQTLVNVSNPALDFPTTSSAALHPGEASS